MPRRRLFFSTGEFYHIYNRSSNRLPIFRNKRDYTYFLLAIEYYSHNTSALSLSDFIREKEKKWINGKESLVETLAYALMPNHYHFLLRQNTESGIHRTMMKVINSYVHYFNKKYDVQGQMFPGPFKAKHIESNEQLIHVSRYIHLNPSTSYITEDPGTYSYSSFQDYIGSRYSFIEPKYILNHFNTRDAYKQFVLDNLDYQRKLKLIEHLI